MIRLKSLLAGVCAVVAVDGFLVGCEALTMAYPGAAGAETLAIMATGATAPFVGLFGTVWGIMDAFLGLSHVKSSSIQAVAPGISEALIDFSCDCNSYHLLMSAWVTSFSGTCVIYVSLVV